MLLDREVRRFFQDLLQEWPDGSPTQALSGENAGARVVDGGEGFDRAKSAVCLLQRRGAGRQAALAAEDLRAATAGETVITDARVDIARNSALLGEAGQVSRRRSDAPRERLVATVVLTPAFMVRAHGRGGCGR